MARKTIPVADVRALVNTLLAAPNSGSVPRSTAAHLLERILMDTGNYHGFNYQSSEFLPESERDYTSGIVLRPDYDDTRRIYF